MEEQHVSVVIYAFRSPGSGAVYIGKHEPKVDPAHWPRRGNGKLPDGYEGSGLVVPRFHARHGERVQWRILAVVPLADWPRAEQRAVDLARAVFGRKCVNIADGGQGFTRAEARAANASPAAVAHRRKLHQSPKFREGQVRGLAIAQTPEVQERARLGLLRHLDKPGEREALADRLRAYRSSPEGRLAQEARMNTPEGRRQLARAQAVAKHAEAWKIALASSRSPDAVAKHSASLKVYGATDDGKAHLKRAARVSHLNNSWRRLAITRPELFATTD
jgi:hypothetical protein